MINSDDLGLPFLIPKADQLAKDLPAIEERLEQLKRQRNILRTRQSRAEALRSSNLDESGVLNDIDSIIERWEIKVTEVEVGSEHNFSNSDNFEQEFKDEEDKTSLRASLNELLAQNN